jgi:copper resistance protein C
MHTASKKPLRVAVPATLVLILALFVGTAPARAHDSVVSTAPSDGATVTANPGKVSVTLSAEPLASEGLKTSRIEVTAPDGHVVSSGDVTIDGATLTIDADIDHEGEHTVAWRSVSADGHPVEGTFAFTYAPEAPAAHASASAAATSAAPAAGTGTAQATGEGTPTADAEPAAATGSGSGTGAFIAGGLILLAAVAAAAFLIGRKAARK